MTEAIRYSNPPTYAWKYDDERGWYQTDMRTISFAESARIHALEKARPGSIWPRLAKPVNA